MLLLLTVITGLGYPLLMTGIARLIFPWEANGSLILDQGRITGSTLIGQQFDDPKYFWPRLSATPQFPYNTGASSGSNFGPLSSDLQKAMDARREALRKADPDNKDEIPLDLITSSASGLDPHISPEAADYQVKRVARLQGIPADAVRRLVALHTSPRQLGFLGEPVVNVVALNNSLRSRKP